MPTSDGVLQDRAADLADQVVAALVGQERVRIAVVGAELQHPRRPALARLEEEVGGAFDGAPEHEHPVELRRQPQLLAAADRERQPRRARGDEDGARHRRLDGDREPERDVAQPLHEPGRHRQVGERVAGGAGLVERDQHGRLGQRRDREEAAHDVAGLLERLRVASAEEDRRRRAGRGDLAGALGGRDDDLRRLLLHEPHAGLLQRPAPLLRARQQRRGLDHLRQRVQHSSPCVTHPTTDR